MKVSMEIFCANAEGVSVAAFAKDVDLTLAVTDVVNSDYDLANFRPNQILSWQITLPNGSQIVWYPFTPGKDDE